MNTERFYQELKELINEDEKIKENVYFDEINKQIEYIELSFWAEEIWISEEYCVAENRTPKQCYEILKNLIK